MLHLSKPLLIVLTALLGSIALFITLFIPLDDAAAPRMQSLSPRVLEPYHAAAVSLGKVEDQSAPDFSDIRHADVPTQCQADVRHDHITRRDCARVRP